MLGKVTSIKKAIETIRLQQPETPYYTVYHGFQVTAKKTSDWCLRNSTQANMDDAMTTLDKWLTNNTENGGQFTIYSKEKVNVQDTSGFTMYLEIPPMGYQNNSPAVHGLSNYTPSVSNEDIEFKISGAISRARMEWEKDLHIKGLQARIEELENEEPEGVNITEVAIGFLETIVNKIPNDAIGRIFENFMGKATGDTVDKMTDVAGKYMTMKMQADAMKAAQTASKQQNFNQSDDDDEEITFEDV